MRKSINGEIYSEENERIADLATSLGWKVDDYRLHEMGLMFVKQFTVVWHCVSIKYGGLIWQVADVVNGEFRNHRPSRNIEHALRNN